jgi:hypothetical protein
MKTFLALLAALLLFGAGVLLAPRLQPWLAHLGHEAPAAAPRQRPSASRSNTAIR